MKEMQRDFVITMTMNEKKTHEQILQETFEKLKEEALKLPNGPERDKAMSFMRKFKSVKENLFG